MWIMALLVGVMSVGCENLTEEPTSGSVISFGTSIIVDSYSRVSTVDNAALVGGSAPVYVVGKRGTTAVYPVSSTDIGERISRDAATAKWFPTTTANKRTWVDNSSYTFNGFAFLPSTAISNGWLTVASGGNSITIKQPSTYLPAQMVDYLLAHTFSVANSSVHPLVQLDLEHAVAMVEVKVVKHSSISEAYLDKIEMAGIWDRASMVCQSPASYNSGESNNWDITYPTEAQRVTYGFYPDNTDPSNPEVPLVYRGEDGEKVLSFLAVPQRMEVSNVLTVGFWVNEKFDEGSADNFVYHEAKFNLYNYTPYVWDSGHRVTYTLEIDTGIRLEGVIAPWVDVDYIEGTVLPDIK